MGLERVSDRLIIALLAFACLFFIAFISFPIAAVFLNLDLDMLTLQLRNPQVLSALTVSIVTSSFATLISFIFGIPTAYLLATRRFPGRSIVDTILDIPIVLPPAVAGIALLLAFAPRGILGPTLKEFGIILPGSTIAVVLAQIFVASPFLIRSAKAAFEDVDRNLVNSAKILSSSRLRVFLTITLPLSSHGLLAGTIMTWARSMGEFGATLMFAGNLPGVTQTMPLAIYMLMAEDPMASNVLSAILIVVSFGVLALFKILGRKRYGARL
ncbi:MAG: ABC transporter permease [Candidatus Bathyarchaeota archaeon]|nr:ABC transporter permease [Candidatus Bathyarchaeota archaeon]